MKSGARKVGWDWNLSYLERMELKDLKKHHDALERKGDLVSDDLELIQFIASCYFSLNLDFLILKIGEIIPAQLSS